MLAIDGKSSTTGTDLAGLGFTAIPFVSINFLGSERTLGVDQRSPILGDIRQAELLPT